MRFYQQFEQFKPLTDYMPESPFSLMPDIAKRARYLLKGRTTKQLVYAAETIDWMVDEYFKTEKSDFIRRAVDSGSWELGYLEEKYRNEASLEELLDNWPFDADDRKPFIPDDENTTQTGALKECIGKYILADDADFPDATESEYFAVLSLWKLADCLHWDRARLNLAGLPVGAREILESLPVSATVEDPSTRLSLAGACAIEAMDAICWAEHQKMLDLVGHSVTRLSEELKQAKMSTNELVQEQVRKSVSITASKAAIKRHSENHAMKADVFAWCAKHLDSFPSMDKAAEAIAGHGKLVPVAVRTARDWIAEWKKSLRPARTP